MWQPRFQNNTPFISTEYIFLNSDYSNSEFWRFRLSDGLNLPCWYEKDFSSKSIMH